MHKLELTSFDELGQRLFAHYADNERLYQEKSMHLFVI